MSKELIEVLRGGRQCDMDGVEIIMSRQACVEAADRIEELECERDSFYMEYRMKCDEETKALLADNERLREALTDVVRVHGYEGGTPVEALSSTPAQSLDALLDPYKAHIERLRGLLEWAKGFTIGGIEGEINEALAATPAPPRRHPGTASGGAGCSAAERDA